LGTDLQEVYTSFFSKTVFDYSLLQDLVYIFLKSALTRAKKNTNHSLEMTFTNEEAFEGYFVEVLDEEEVEYIALWMRWYEASRATQQVVKMANSVGSNVFYRNETNKSLMESKIAGQQQAYSDVILYEQDFFYM